MVGSTTTKTSIRPRRYSLSSSSRSRKKKKKKKKRRRKCDDCRCRRNNNTSRSTCYCCCSRRRRKREKSFSPVSLDATSFFYRVCVRARERARVKSGDRREFWLMFFPHKRENPRKFFFIFPQKKGFVTKEKIICISCIT